MKVLRIACALAAALFAASCLPVTTDVPAGTTAGLGGDPALIGTWEVVPDKPDQSGPRFVHFVAAKDGPMTVLLVDTGKKNSDGEWSVSSASTATLGGRHYLNVRAVSENGKPAEAADMLRNVPLLYRIDRRGMLRVFLIDEDKAKAAIEAGKIDGRVEPGEFGDVIITAPAVKLDAFIASGDGAALFTQKLLVLKRVE